MASEKFCLRWNDFETNISGAFRELRDDKDFFDVTIACDDDQLQAHKMILSACSPFFRSILRRNPHQHPLLYLKGVKYSDLQSILNFMYMGEVNVAQEELNSFLSVAEDLKVKGLTQNQSEGHPGPKEQYPNTKSEPQPLSSSQINRLGEYAPPKRPRPQPPFNPPSPHREPSAVDDIQEVYPVKSEPKESVTSVQPVALPSQEVDPYASSQPSNQTVAQVEDDSLVYHDESYEDYGQYEDQLYMAHSDQNPVPTGESNLGNELFKIPLYSWLSYHL